MSVILFSDSFSIVLHVIELRQPIAMVVLNRGAGLRQMFEQSKMYLYINMLFFFVCSPVLRFC